MSIKLEAVTYTYGIGSPFEKKALYPLDLEIKEGDFIGIIGHTGSGKSTLVQLLNGLIQPTGGRVVIDGTDISPKTRGGAQGKTKSRDGFSVSRISII